MSWVPILSLVAVVVALLWACGADARTEQELRSAICDQIRARGIVMSGVVEEMYGLPGPGEQMPASPGDTPCDPVSEAVS